jgi:hypothetical protein
MWPPEIPPPICRWPTPRTGATRAHLPMEGGGAGWPGGATHPQRGAVGAAAPPIQGLSCGPALLPPHFGSVSLASERLAKIFFAS